MIFLVFLNINLTSMLRHTMELRPYLWFGMYNFMCVCVCGGGGGAENYSETAKIELTQPLHLNAHCFNCKLHYVQIVSNHKPSYVSHVHSIEICCIQNPYFYSNLGKSCTISEHYLYWNSHTYTLLTKLCSLDTLNPFNLNGMSHYYQLDQSFSILRAVGN